MVTSVKTIMLIGRHTNNKSVSLLSYSYSLTKTTYIFSNLPIITAVYGTSETLNQADWLPPVWNEDSPIVLSTRACRESYSWSHWKSHPVFFKVNSFRYTPGRDFTDRRSDPARIAPRWSSHCKGHVKKKKRPTVVVSLMLVACLVVEIIQRWFCAFADQLWPWIKVKIIRHDWAWAYIYMPCLRLPSCQVWMP